MTGSSDNYIQVPDASCSYYDGRAHPTGLCPSAFNVSKSQDGTYDLTSYVCNEDASDADLVFQTTNEVDFAIGKGRTELWRWSRWHAPRDHRHTLRITPGSCTNWDFVWTGVDASGETLKPGDYDLTVSFLTDPLKTRSITVTVTVS